MRDLGKRSVIEIHVFTPLSFQSKESNCYRNFRRVANYISLSVFVSYSPGHVEDPENGEERKGDADKDDEQGRSGLAHPSTGGENH